MEIQSPKCPKCNTNMFIRAVPRNDEGVNSQLVCENKDCPVVLNARCSATAWYQVSAIATPNDLKRQIDTLRQISKQDPLPGRDKDQEPKVCPRCGEKKYYFQRACCGTPSGFYWCDACGYEQIL
jgi:DNA-directed RNA polymerase subunit M/transcription elongation factor TFIIS